MSDDSFKGMRITSDPDLTAIEKPGQDPSRAVHKLPLRLLAVSNLTPQDTVADWSGASRLHQVDKNNFDAVMQAMAPQLALDVPNTLSDTPKQWELTLSFADLDAFHPTAVAAQVPALAQLVAVRGLVVQVQDGALSADAFRAELDSLGADPAWADKLAAAFAAPKKASPPPPSSGGDDSLDRLLGMVDTGTDETPSSGSGGGIMGALIDAVTGDEGTPAVQKGATNQVLSEIDGALGGQLNAILGHEAFRSLESAWRGLKFLVDRLDFRKGISLDVLAAGKEDLSAALYYQVLLPEHGGEIDRPPLSLIALDASFDNSSADIALLDDLADTGASLQAPILVSASPAFFGVDSYAGVTTLPPLRQLVQRPEYIAWNKLREKKTARYLALALPAFLLRPSYGTDRPVKAFGFEEKGRLWGNASLAVAASIAGGFAKTGWPTRFLGSSQSIDNMPLWKSRQGHTPLAAFVPDSKLSEFSKGGFVVLGGRANHDGFYVARAMVVCAPEAYEDLMAATEARIHVTLACTMFVARAAHYLLATQATLTPSIDAEDVRKEMEARLRAFFVTEGQRVPPDAVEVQLVDDSGVEGQELLAIRLKTPSYVLDRAVSLVMGLPLPKGA